MDDVMLHFEADGERTLEQAVRTELGSGGRPPSKTRVRSWVREGRVLVEGAEATDPAAVPTLGDRVEVRRVSEAAGPAACAATPGAGAGCATQLLHVDRHLLVASWTPPTIVGTDLEPLRRGLLAGLEEGGVRGLCVRLVPDPVPRVGGLVAAALSPVAEAHLAATLGEGRVRIELTLLAAADGGADTSELDVADALPGVVRVTWRGPVPPAVALADLRARGIEPLPRPGPGPAKRRPLLACVTGLDLPHPTTGRELTFRIDAPALGL